MGEGSLEEVRIPKTRPMPPLIGLMLPQKPDQEEEDPEQVAAADLLLMRISSHRIFAFDESYLKDWDNNE